MTKTGVLIVGLNGGVSTTSVAAALAITKQICPPWGLYTETGWYIAGDRGLFA